MAADTHFVADVSQESEADDGEHESADTGALRAESEQTEDQLQAVVDRYEALLAERSRAAQGEDPVWTDDGVGDDEPDETGWRTWVSSLF